MDKNNILEVKNLYKTFISKKIVVKAVTDVSFSIHPGETIGIVGESGCGKTTLGRCIARAYQATSGEVWYRTMDGQEVDFLKVEKDQMKKIRKEIQMVFQDPYSSLDPRMTVLDIIKEPLRANYKGIMSDKEMNAKVMDIANRVGLNTTYLKRYPHAFSGGQRQRIGIARALVVDPKIVICDEAVSAEEQFHKAADSECGHTLHSSFCRQARTCSGRHRQTARDGRRSRYACNDMREQNRRSR